MCPIPLKNISFFLHLHKSRNLMSTGLPCSASSVRRGWLIDLHDAKQVKEALGNQTSILREIWLIALDHNHRQSDHLLDCDKVSNKAIEVLLYMQQISCQVQMLQKGAVNSAFSDDVIKRRTQDIRHVRSHRSRLMQTWMKICPKNVAWPLVSLDTKSLKTTTHKKMQGDWTGEEHL